jgi:AbrB family looped-hinge helix DNA binding protein
MIRELVRVRDRNQITLPAEIAERLSVQSGALLELIMDPDQDYLEVRRAEVVRAGTPQASREEQWAKEDIKAGRFNAFANPEEFALHLRNSREAAKLQEQLEILQRQVQGLVLDVHKMSAATGVSLVTAPIAETSK